MVLIVNLLVIISLTVWPIVVSGRRWVNQPIYGSVATHARWRHYENVTELGCGRGRQSVTMLGKCFKWQNIMGTGQIQQGRDAQSMEAPWIVYFHFSYVPWYLPVMYTKWYCTGSIINRRWILTAGHCLYLHENDKPHPLVPNWAIISDLSVWPGLQDWPSRPNSYSVADYWVFPAFTASQKANSANDIGLIKLKQDIPLRSDSDDTGASDGEQIVRNQMNAICLPDMGLRNNDSEWAYFAGWGALGPSRQNWGRLQIGSGRIRFDIIAFKADKKPNYWKENSTYLSLMTGPGEPTMCHGDSGGPWWQYDSGRAIQVGVMSMGTGDKVDGYCPHQDYNKELTGVRVSYKMDWIVDTVRKHGMT